MHSEFIKNDNPDVNPYPLNGNLQRTSKYRENIIKPFWKQWHKINGEDTERYCACCIRKDQTLDVHHLTYKNSPYQEQYEDLVQLCKDCHQLVHQYHMQWLYNTTPRYCTDRFENISLATATTDFINLVHDCYSNNFNLTAYWDKDKHNVMRIRNMFECVRKRKAEGRIKHKEWILTQWPWCNKFIEQNTEWRDQVNTRTPLQAEKKDNKRKYYKQNKKKTNKYVGLPKELSRSGKGLGNISEDWKWRANKIASARGEFLGDFLE